MTGWRNRRINGEEDTTLCKMVERRIRNTRHRLKSLIEELDD